MDRNDVEIISTTARYEGYSSLHEYRLRHRRFDGGWTDTVVRELVERGNAVCVLPYDPVRDTVVLIEQFRIGAYVAGVAPWQIETVAGIIDPGESEEDVARRECLEECGCTIAELHFVCRVLSSSGIMSELTAVFCGIVDATAVSGIHGLDHEHEDIRAGAFPFEDAAAMIADGRFQHAHGVIALQWLAANRDRLRATARTDGDREG